ncbi:hypothetical protein C8R47DRAFT_1195156 [Mycena vitilis]|nr:hypothetical protein C8R47DRAFT_1195156 [Mycena vitilis]
MFRFSLLLSQLSYDADIKAAAPVHHCAQPSAFKRRKQQPVQTCLCRALRALWIPSFCGSSPVWRSLALGSAAGFKTPHETTRFQRSLNGLWQEGPAGGAERFQGCAPTMACHPHMLLQALSRFQPRVVSALGTPEVGLRRRRCAAAHARVHGTDALAQALLDHPHEHATARYRYERTGPTQPIIAQTLPSTVAAAESSTLQALRGSVATQAGFHRRTRAHRSLWQLQHLPRRASSAVDPRRLPRNPAVPRL